MHILKHILIHSLEDNISIIPFLFITYCVMEYLEHLMEEKAEAVVRYSGKMGPLWGGLLGLIPQCGFSAAAASFFFRRCDHPGHHAGDFLVHIG